MYCPSYLQNDPPRADLSLPKPEDCGSNPIIGEFLHTFFYCQLYLKDENKEKEAGNEPFKKSLIRLVYLFYDKLEGGIRTQDLTLILANDLPLNHLSALTTIMLVVFFVG